MRLAIASGYDFGGDQSDEQHPRVSTPSTVEMRVDRAPAMASRMD